MGKSRGIALIYDLIPFIFGLTNLIFVIFIFFRAIFLFRRLTPLNYKIFYSRGAYDLIC